ncbi:MAG: TRAP transporter small permease [Betaproteobacteria bacterium]|nr:TRAP transporter small permease [Betaproteobacteria bacterium]
MRPLDAFDRVLESALGAAAALTLAAMMALTCVDVVGRYLFTRPIPGALEIVEIMMGLIIFTALPLVTMREEHVTVDLLDALTPDWLLRVQHVASSLLGAGVAGVLAWQLFLRAARMLGYGDTTAVLKITLHPLTFAMASMMALTALAFLARALRPPTRRVRKD